MPPTRPPEQAPIHSSPPATGIPAHLPAVGEQFDKYTLLAKLATGGMAELFVARIIGASGFRKNVVIKRILPHVAHDEHFTRMFLDEAITCAQISHPNVCQVFELCEAQGSHFLVLEHLEGVTVGDLIRRCLVAGQQLNLELAAGILVQACDGLHAAHEQVDEDDKSIELVHRDVSPGNLFVTVDGIVKVLDFGIAKAAWMSRKTRTGTLLGKCEFMSPEQARGGVPVDRRSDIFSLGIVAWEMLCGRRLFRRKSEYETLKAVLRAPIERPRDLRPTVPVALDEAIMRALERDPDDRYRSANEFRHAIADALKDRGGATPMCNIAPLIRSSFAEELRMQRAVLKEASRLSQRRSAPGLRRVPRGTLPPGPPLNEDTTDLRTQPHQALPRLESGPSDDPESKELTFRVMPKTPPRGPALTFTAKEESDEPVLLTKKAVATPRSKRSTGGIPHSAARAWHDRLSGGHETAPASVESKRARTEMAGSRLRPVGLLLTVALLGAGLAGTLTFIYYGRTSQSSGPPAQTLAAPETGALATAKTVSQKSKPAVRASATTRTSADQNEKEHARILAANASPALVTSLHSETGDAAAKTGSLSIRSTQPATIYLYPRKTILGTTPLIDLRLPAGTHKLKAQVGSGKGQRKYFHVTVQAGKSSTRSFDHWKL